MSAANNLYEKYGHESLLRPQNHQEPSQDPSMEDILSSIRAIISEDRQPKPTQETALDDSSPLLGPEADDVVTTSFRSFKSAVATHGREIAENAAREAIKPLLKSWLDEHLPPIVERIVRAELSRLAGNAH